MPIDPRTGQSRYNDALAQALIAQGMQTSPVAHPAQGAARIAQALSGAFIQRKANEKRTAESAALADALRGAFASEQGGNPDRNTVITNLLSNPATANLPLTQSLIADALEGQKPETFGQPVAGIGPNGEEMFFRPGNRGGMEPVEGIKPRPKTPLVNIDNKGETKEAEELAKLRVDKYGKLQEVSGAARGRLQLYDQILSGMENFTTGQFGGARLTLSRTAELFGIDPEKIGLDDAASGEQIEAAANKLAQLARAGEGEGTTLAGQMSDRDVQFLLAQNASIGKTARGNRMIIANQRKAAERVVEKQDFFDNWLTEKDTLRGAAQAWNKFERENPLFSEDDKKALDLATKKPSEMSIEELTALDMNALSPSELIEAEKRWNSLAR